MKIKAQSKTLSNTDYSSNFDRIFGNNSSKLDKLIPAINKVDIHLNNDIEMDYGNRNNKFF